MKIIKTFIAGLIIIAQLNNPSLANESQLPDDVLLAIGKIVVFEDNAERHEKIGRNPYTPEAQFILIEQEFNAIKSKHSKDIQIDFLWSIMVRASFGSHYSERFVALIEKCCEIEFQNAIRDYQDSGSKTNKNVLHKAKFIQHYLSVDD